MVRVCDVQFKEQIMLAVVLAGGFGERLRLVLIKFPKPMAPVAGKPFLEYLVLQLKSHGLMGIVLCIGYLGGQVKRYFDDGHKWSVHISYSHEPEPLSTGGAVKLAEKLTKKETSWS